MVLAEDEAALISVPTITRQWAVRGQQPQVLADTAHRQRVTLFGAVNWSTGELTGAVADRGNRDTFRAFLDQLLEAYPGKQLLLILDNVRFHHAKDIQAFLETEPRLELVFLPAYSPELNPQEWVWRQLRQAVTYNAVYPTFTDELKAVHDWLKTYRLPMKEILRRII